MNGSLHLYMFVLGIIFREDGQGIADTLVDPIWIIMLEKLKNVCIKDHKSVFNDSKGLKRHVASDRITGSAF